MIVWCFLGPLNVNNEVSVSCFLNPNLQPTMEISSDFTMNLLSLISQFLPPTGNGSIVSCFVGPNSNNEIIVRCFLSYNLQLAMETSSAVLDSRSDQTLRLNRSIHPVVASEDSLDERPNSIRWRPVVTYNARTTATIQAWLQFRPLCSEPTTFGWVWIGGKGVYGFRSVPRREGGHSGSFCWLFYDKM